MYECGCGSWKFCLGFLWAAAHFNVLFTAFPREGNEALGILVLENCKVGITFTLCMRSSDVFPTDSLQIFFFTYWTCSLSQYFLMILLQWIDSVIFHLHGSPNLCASRRKRTTLVLFSSLPEAESLALGVIGQDKVMVFCYHRSCGVEGLVLVTLYLQLCKFGLTGPFLQLFLGITVT